MFGFSTLQTGAAGLGIVGLLWWLYDNRAYLESFIPTKKFADPNAVPTGEEAYAAAMLLGAWLESPLLLAAGSFGVLAQVPHYYAHRRAPRAVRWLQRAGIILSPQHHAEHHRGDFDRNFCILSGWCNHWLNWAIGVKNA